MITNKDRILEGFRVMAWNKPFDWETHNCVTYALSLLTAMYGITFEDFPTFKGKTKLEYFKIMKDKPLNAYATEKFGNPLPSTKLARKGDLVMEGEGLEQNVGICYGKDVAFFPKEKGLLSVSLNKCTYAWSMKDYG